MNSKSLKLIIFSSLAVITVLGGYGTYRLLQPPEKLGFFTPDPKLADLESDPARAKKTGGLLGEGRSPASARTNESHARVRSPAFHREMTLDEKTMEKFRTLVKRNGLAVEEAELKKYIPDQEGTGFLVRNLLLIVRAGGAIQAENEEALDYIRTFLTENPQSAVSTLSRALEVLPKDKSVAKTTVMQQMVQLASTREEVRADVKTSLLAEMGRENLSMQGFSTLEIVMGLEQKESWYNEVRVSFEKTHPGERFADFVVLQRAQ